MSSKSMTRRGLERRLDALEAQGTAAAPLMRAVQYIGEPGIDANTVELVVGGERMHIDEWQRRYPTGVLISIDIGDD